MPARVEVCALMVASGARWRIAAVVHREADDPGLRARTPARSEGSVLRARERLRG